MNELLLFLNNNYLSIIIVVIVILGILLFINITGWDLNPVKPESKLVQQVTVETFTENINSLDGGMSQEQNGMGQNLTKEIDPLDELKMNSPSDSFCHSYQGNSKELDTECNRLTKSNCDITSCCVRTIDNKCSAGSIEGPTYPVGSDGTLITKDMYYYLGKCYGKKCE